jgi:broad specificity phosphatase PhoE
MMPELAEQYFGEWQGLTYEELQESRAGDFHGFCHAPAHETPPGGESFIAVTERVSRSIHQLVETYSGRDAVAVGWRVVKLNQRLAKRAGPRQRLRT